MTSNSKTEPYNSSEMPEEGLPIQKNEPDEIQWVTWEGPEDRNNPMQWPSWKKLATVMLVSSIGFISPFASSVSAPATEAILTSLGRPNDDIIASFTVSIYVLGTAVGPILFAPASEVWGRSIIFHTCNILFVGFIVGCALSKTLTAFMVFRFLAGCAGAAPLVVGGGTIADIIPVENRGKYIAIFSVGGLLGPIIGPVVGGFLAQYAGWRWTFWVVAIIGGGITIACAFLLRETHAPTILAGKAKALRKETGHNNLKAEGEITGKIAVVFTRALKRPANILIQSPVALPLALYQALLYSYIYLMFTTFPQVFEGQYHFSVGASGLAYLGLGIGTTAAMLLSARLSDRIMLSEAKQRDNEPKPEARLVLMAYGGPILAIGLFWYGWSADQKVHWLVPMIGTVVIGVGILTTSLPGNLYVIDAFTQYAASALAGSFFLRAIAGGLIPLAGQPMFRVLGVGWGASVLAFIVLGMCFIPLVLLKFGEALRVRFPVKL